MLPGVAARLADARLTAAVSSRETVPGRASYLRRDSSNFPLPAPAEQTEAAERGGEEKEGGGERSDGGYRIAGDSRLLVGTRRRILRIWT